LEKRQTWNLLPVGSPLWTQCSLQLTVLIWNSGIHDRVHQSRTTDPYTESDVSCTYTYTLFLQFSCWHNTPA
jgi:hypothetical protein